MYQEEIQIADDNILRNRVQNILQQKVNQQGYGNDPDSSLGPRTHASYLEGTGEIAFEKDNYTNKFQGFSGKAMERMYDLADEILKTQGFRNENIREAIVHKLAGYLVNANEKALNKIDFKKFHPK